MKVKEVLVATHTYGWNVKHNRPATREESFRTPLDICACEVCRDDPHYGSHYCKRYGSTDERFYSDHHTRWK